MTVKFQIKFDCLNFKLNLIFRRFWLKSSTMILQFQVHKLPKKPSEFPKITTPWYIHYYYLLYYHFFHFLHKIKFMEFHFIGIYVIVVIFFLIFRFLTICYIFYRNAIQFTKKFWIFSYFFYFLFLSFSSSLLSFSRELCLL